MELLRANNVNLKSLILAAMALGLPTAYGQVLHFEVGSDGVRRLHGSVSDALAAALSVPAATLLNEALYFAGFVPLGGYLWLRRSRLYGPKKPTPPSSASGATATAAVRQTRSTSRQSPPELEVVFQAAPAVVGSAIIYLQMFASLYWYVEAQKPSHFTTLYVAGVSAALVGSLFIAALIDLVF